MHVKKHIVSISIIFCIVDYKDFNLILIETTILISIIFCIVDYKDFNLILIETTILRINLSKLLYITCFGSNMQICKRFGFIFSDVMQFIESIPG